MRLLNQNSTRETYLPEFISPEFSFLDGILVKKELKGCKQIRDVTRKIVRNVTREQNSETLAD